MMIMPYVRRSPTRDEKLAFIWHTVETAVVGTLGVIAIIGWHWSWRHLGRTYVETSEEIAQRKHDA